MNQARVSPFWLFNLSKILVTWIGISTLLIAPSPAQVFEPGPSTSSEFDTVINLPGDEAIITGAVRESIGGIPGQTVQLNVEAGGFVGSSFDALSGSEVNISDGTVDSGFEAFSGSEVNVSGGTHGGGFSALSGSVLNISGGSIDGGVGAASGSEVNISGGTFDTLSNLRSGSEVNISGGSFGRRFSAEGSDVQLIGGDFRLNGISFTDSTITLAEGDSFSGTLADGSAFIFSNAAQSLDSLTNVTLTESTLPATNLNPITVSSASGVGLSSLRAGQTLTLQAGGSLRENFEAVGATLNLEGGFLRRSSEFSESVLNITGGNTGDFVEAYFSEVNILSLIHI